MTFNGTNSNGDERNLFVPSEENKWSYSKIQHTDGRNNEKSIIGTFTVVDEDHTFGQLMRHTLAKNPDVLSSGYIIPHPLENILKLHCRTKPTTTPPEAVDGALRQCLHQLLTLRKQLASEVKRVDENKDDNAKPVNETKMSLVAGVALNPLP